jgi:hypothetical protein
MWGNAHYRSGFRASSVANPTLALDESPLLHRPHISLQRSEKESGARPDINTRELTEDLFA